MSIYRPPEFSKAYDLIEEIMSFLEDCGGPYVGIREQIEETKYHGIILSVLHGQFIYRKGWYFASWFRVTDESLEQIKQYVMPSDITIGDILYIAELNRECGNWYARSKHEIIRGLKRGASIATSRPGNSLHGGHHNGMDRRRKQHSK
jgi:hypothetical protein